MTFATPSLEALGSRIARRLLGVLVLVLTTSSLIYLLAFSNAFHVKLKADAAAAALRTNAVLAGSLMTTDRHSDKIYWPYLMSDLGTTSGLVRAALIDDKGVVRFSTDSAVDTVMLSGTPIDRASASIVSDMTGQSVARSINPLRNESRCQACHGAAGAKPVLGALIVDTRADTLFVDTLRGATLMTLAGGTVLVASLLAIASMLAWRVLIPIKKLHASASAFAGGDFHARANVTGNDEMSELAARFNAMVENIRDMVTSIRTNEEFLQHIIDAVPDGIRVIARDYTVLMVNTAYRAQLGVSPDDVVGQPCYVSSHRQDSPCSPRLVTCPLVELSSSGRTSLRCHHRHVRKDGSEMFVEVSAAVALFNRGGKVEDCVIESVRALGEQAEASHKYRLAELGQLAAGIAHEIHNPLWSIHLALSAIRNDLTAPKHLQSIESYIETADHEINRCLSVTDRMLKLSEPSSDQITIVQVHAVVADIVRLVSFEAAKFKIDIAVDVPTELRISANESDFSIVVLNLVQNAIHAMPNGGELSIRASHVEKNIALVVKDTGVGIQPEDLSRIFWPFWSRRADGVPGTGLGLSIVEAIAKRLGGVVSVTSKFGEGSVFTVKLPNVDMMVDMT